MFQIPLILALSLASASQLNLLPYAYLSSPIPIYNQYQNTVTGEHAYSYAGGPSAKEEVKDANGVLRGSYSYVDANGVLQSAFYVADDNGFRVAATNIPTDENQNDLETTAHVILARSAVAERSSTPSRRRRSLQDSNLEKSGQKEQSLDSVQNDTKKQAAPSQSPPSTSSSLLLQPLLLSNNNIPLATSHQSQVQVHSNARLEAKPVDLHPILPVQTILGGLPVLARTPTYHENRIELHKQLGIEGPRPKDAVKIKPEPLTVVRSVLPLASTVLAGESVPVLPTIVKETVPVLPAQLTSVTTTSVSSHGVSQIHGSSNVVAKEGIAVAPTVVERKEIAHVPAIPVVKGEASVTSYGVSQIHGGEINPIGLLVKTAPAVAQIHPAIHVPLYL